VRLFDDFSGQKSRAVLLYLAKQESREVDPHLQDDIRIAWKCVLNAALGEFDPWGFAFWSYFGKTHTKALSAWAERDRKANEALERCAAMVREEAHREATNGVNPQGQSTVAVASAVKEQPTQAGHDLELECSNRETFPPTTLYDSARQMLALPPKKPAHSVRRRKERAA
jgi:hypothetical protein